LGGTSKGAALLQVAELSVRAYQRIKDSQDMAAVLHHAGKDVAELRLAFRILMPFRKDRRRDFNVVSQLLRGMPAQEQSIKKGRFSLWKVEIRNEVSRQHWSDGRHGENAVYRNPLRRQVELRFPCREPVTGGGTPCNGSSPYRPLTGSNLP
jgi:hypothetical protein